MIGNERDLVEEEDDASFPTSDPPSWTLGKTAGPPEQAGVREVVGVFPDTTSFSRAIDALQSAGIDRARLSVLAGGPAAEAQLRSSGFHRVQELLDSADAPRMALVEPESVRVAQGAAISGLFYVGAALGAGAAFASGAVAAVPIIAAALGSGAAGGTLGGLLAYGLGQGRARYAEAHLAHGGLVLWARVVTDEEERRVAALMRGQGGHEVHAHGARDRSSSETGEER